MLYIDNCLYYEAIGDFTRDTVRITNANTYAVSFYKNVVGMMEIDAINALNALGYRTIQINREASSQPAGMVIGQTPTFEGSPHLDSGTTIILTVSKGLGDDSTTYNSEGVYLCLKRF